jgi:chemotaxis protein methyltransferase WspC
MPDATSMNFQDELAVWLASGFGLELAIFGAGSVDAVIGERCRALGLPERATYPARWQRDARERMAFLERLLVGETWFFREWAAFALLGEWLDCQSGRFTAATPLRILALPCASGEEAWSLAAVTHEAGLRSSHVSIEAMDVSPSALQQATRGIYPQRQLRSQPLSRWEHLLHPETDATLRVDDDLRDRVRFIEANAMDSEFLLARPPFHIIFCRNMMIYMSGEARNRVCATLGQCLASDGLLFLGHAEQAPAGSGLTRKDAHGAFAWCRRGELPATDMQAATRKPRALPGVMTRRRITPMAAPRPAINQARVNPAPVQLAPSVACERPGIDLEALHHLADQGRYAEALTALETPAATQSLDPDVHNLAGVLLGALDRKAEAMARWRRALYLDPAHSESLLHLALSLEDHGDREGAARLRGRLVHNTREARS